LRCRLMDKSRSEVFKSGAAIILGFHLNGFDSGRKKTPYWLRMDNRQPEIWFHELD
jgi:hypothetical protein